MRIDVAQLRLLGLESVRDAARRRIVPVVLLVCFLSLLMINSCTSCNAEVHMSGDLAAPLDVLGWAGVAVFGVLALWSIALAGLLAADHLRSALEDGSAQLVLARPVARETFVLSRLLGSLAVSLSAGLILMLAASFLLVTRSGLAPTPALLATTSALVSSVTLAALAMTASLHLPRVATFLLVLIVVAFVSLLDLMAVSGVELSGLYGVVERLGPPLASGVALALAPWSGRAPELADLLRVVVLQLVWLASSLWLLLFAFAQRELPQVEAR